jgi:hypothetical protein
VESWLRERFGNLLGEDVTFRALVVAECTKTASGKRNPIINRTTRTTPAAGD